MDRTAGSSTSLIGGEAAEPRPRHRFWLPPDAIDGDRVVFSPAQAHQMTSVLRLRAGANVRVFDGVQPVDREVHLVRLSREQAEGQCVATHAQPPEPRTRLIAYPAMVQREKLENVFQKLVEVGVTAITPVVTGRCEVRKPPDHQRLARWQSIVREAVEQSGRGVVPTLGVVSNLDSALETAAHDGVVLMGSPGGTPLRAALESLQPDATVSIFVGPEGGFSPDEIDLARNLGATVVSLGPRTLRTETASPVLAALVLYELDAGTI